MTQDMPVWLDDINAEIKNLGKAMLKLRYDDIKLVFSEQMVKAVEDYSRSRLRPEAARPVSCAQCRMRDDCKDRLPAVVMEAAESLKEGRSEQAIEQLDELEALILSDRSPCQDPTCSRNALVVLGKARASVELFNAISERLAIPTPAPLPETTARPAPHQAASVITTMAHPKRLEIMERLAQQDSSFSEIGRAVGLKTGHLQFHLRPLLENGLIENEGRGHAYRLTNKGAQALAGLSDMICRMSMA